MGLGGERFSVLSRLRPWILSRARKLCRGRPEADAEDLVQDALERYMEHFRATPHPDTEQGCMAWLATTLRNALISKLRRERAHRDAEPHITSEQSAVPDPADPPPSASVTDGELRRAMDGLSAKQRDVLELNLRGKRYAEIAEALRIREGTVAKRLFDARKRLAKILLARSGVRAGAGAWSAGS